MLARAVEREAASRGLTLDAFPHAELDLLNPQHLDRITPDHHAVINCAAWTDVDGAEAHEDAATELNGHAVARLADRCHRIDAALVHFSTDYVFDGSASTPYPTDHQRSPVNAYGRSKAVGEQALEASPARSVLIRTSWLYAPWGRNFVLTMADLIARHDEVRVVNDQRGRPSSASQLARRSLDLLNADASGAFHLTDAGECTWFDFAREIARRIGEPENKVTPCATADMPRPAPRPAYSVLHTARADEIIGAANPWSDELAAVLDHARSTDPRTRKAPST
jgi:dTDP-4-dehydrorhamnose reductase